MLPALRGLLAAGGFAFLLRVGGEGPDPFLQAAPLQVLPRAFWKQAPDKQHGIQVSEMGPRGSRQLH